MWESLIDYTIIIILIIVPLFYFLRRIRMSKAADKTLQSAIKRGRDQPVSLHPVINPDRCIGSGACVKACPEKNVLGLIEDHGTLINPANCIGHGVCAASCPMDAITLVFGTEKRGVDIPHVKANFETNIDGLYIAGELGGMGLIRNAIIQGHQAARYIAESLTENKMNDSEYDLVIAGAGPAGISAAITAKSKGLKYKLIDRDDLAATIMTYPRNKVVMTHGAVIPEYGKVKPGRLSKNELLVLLDSVRKKTALKVTKSEEVTDIIPENGSFRVITTKDEYRSRRVLLTIGRRGTPRQLRIPGAKSEKVAYRLIESEKYTGLEVAVIGGGDSAAEAALSLLDAGAKVSLIHRGQSCNRAKEETVLRLEQAEENGSIRSYYNCTVQRIEAEFLILKSDDKEFSISNEYVFIFIGGELPTPFLERIGVSYTRKFGER